MRRAKAFVISLLGEFSEISGTKRVNMEAKVVQSPSVERCLIEEAASLRATYLVVGGSGNPSQSVSSTIEIKKYCFSHAPEGCMVMAIGRQRDDIYQGPESDHPNRIGAQNVSTERDARAGKVSYSLLRLFGTRKKRAGLSFDKTDPANEEGKGSPRTVLDRPEDGADHPAEEPSSLACSNKDGSSRHWRRLSMVQWFLPLLNSVVSDGLRGEGCSPTGEANIVKTSWRCFNYEEISNATDDFHDDQMVGRGGYAEVFRGTLEDGQVIAVKRLAKGRADMHKEGEFLAELGILGQICHPNTAHLIGCCTENGLHLILSFCPNGSLASALHGRKKVLEWQVRYKIATGIARGLHYLHKCCRRRIIHRDIKASNILLGEDYEPQISDFGLARWLPQEWNYLSIIPVEGTFGYLAPEYFMHGIVNEKTDVYAFGVLLLELITGRRPVGTSKQSLIQWVKPYIQSGHLEGLVDPELERYEIEQVKKLALTASYCIRQSASWRPSMNEVLEIITEGHDSTVAERWRMPENRADGLDDYTSYLNDHCSF